MVNFTRPRSNLWIWALAPSCVGYCNRQIYHSWLTRGSSGVRVVIGRKIVESISPINWPLRQTDQALSLTFKYAWRFCSGTEAKHMLGKLNLCLMSSCFQRAKERERQKREKKRKDRQCKRDREGKSARDLSFVLMTRAPAKPRQWSYCFLSLINASSIDIKHPLMTAAVLWPFGLSTIVIFFINFFFKHCPNHNYRRSLWQLNSLCPIPNALYQIPSLMTNSNSNKHILWVQAHVF